MQIPCGGKSVEPSVLTYSEVCHAIYRYPQIPRNVPSLSLAALGRRHGGDHRSVFIEEPRVRMDGCYISVCHYM